MRKYWLIGYSGLVLALLAVFVPSSILMEPNVTGAEYLASIPHTIIYGIVLIKPSSSLIVYALGISIIVVGIMFLNLDNRTRRIWGTGIILWGIGTLLAGSSYQMFGYELKCIGQTYCSFTSWWELAYLYITGLSIAFMTAAILHYVYKEKYVTIPIYGAALYGLVLIIGSIIDINLLITYEFFLLYFFWFFLVMLIVNIKEYRKTKELYHYKLIRTWINMLVINIVYFVYLFSGIPEWLWQRGIWFSANDVLHIGIFIWFYVIWRNLKNEMV